MLDPLVSFAVVSALWCAAIMGVQAWFGTTADCIDAACTGRWNGALR